MLILSLATVAVAAVAAPFLARALGRLAGWPLAGALLVAAALLLQAWRSGATELTWEWMPTLNVALALKLDGLALTFGLLVLTIGAVVLAYSAGYLPRGQHRGFYGFMSAFAAAMLLLVLADDVVALFVAWEATTLCSFFLISRSGVKAHEPAVRTLLVTALGGLALLSAVVVMISEVGSTRISVILADSVWTQNSGVTATVATLLAIAGFTKSAQFPFQSWLPDSMVAITPVSAYLHAAAMVKAGVYLLFRFSPAFAGYPLWSVLLIGAGLTTALLGSVAALRRHDLKELLAYSTISQLGFLIAMIGVGTPEALAAALAHTVAHALFKSSLFLVVGVIDHTVGTRDIRKLEGVPSRMPVTAGITVVAAASMAGVPPLLGFVSKEGLLGAFWDSPGSPWTGPLLAVILAIFAVFTFGYAARIVIGVFGGSAEDFENATPMREAAPLLWVPVAIPAAVGIGAGLIPGVLDGLVSAGATAASGETVEAHLSLWHGFTPAFVLSMLVLAAGVAITVKRVRVDALLAPLKSPVSGLAVVDAVRAGIIAGGARVGALTATTAPRRHLYIPVICLVLIAAIVSLQGLELPPALAGLDTVADWGLLALVVTGVVGAVLARTRIAAVVVVGVVGFGVTAWFFALGAADVALTQLLVEILTVVVMVLVLRRLPRKFRAEKPKAAVGPAVVALGAGAATTAGVLALTGRRELSDAGSYYVEQGEAETGGANLVNTILVEFRAFDTLGELTVLGVAGVAIMALITARKTLGLRESSALVDAAQPLADSAANSVFIRVVARVAVPVTVVLSAVLLLRGHQEPGGGFIAALMTGAGFALLYLAAPSDAAARIPRHYGALIAAGVLAATGAGLLGYLEGSFLTPVHADVLGLHLTSALLFDIGVYLAVIGVFIAALYLLGVADRHQPARSRSRRRRASKPDLSASQETAS